MVNIPYMEHLVNLVNLLKVVNMSMRELCRCRSPWSNLHHRLFPLILWKIHATPWHSPGDPKANETWSSKPRASSAGANSSASCPMAESDLLDLWEIIGIPWIYPTLLLWNRPALAMSILFQSIDFRLKSWRLRSILRFFIGLYFFSSIWTDRFESLSNNMKLMVSLFPKLNHHNHHIMVFKWQPGWYRLELSAQYH